MLINKTMKTLLAIFFIFFSVNVHANKTINEEQGLIELLELGFDIVDVVQSSSGFVVYILQRNEEIVHCEYTAAGKYKACWQVERNK